jgi:hypothetical protein
MEDFVMQPSYPLFGNAPSITLREGLEKTYHWIYEQMAVPVGAQ